MELNQTQPTDISDLFQQLPSNNTGEAHQSSSSLSPFNKVLNGLFPPHPQHTSPEERKANETSPDYSSKDQDIKSDTEKDIPDDKLNSSKDSENLDKNDSIREVKDSPKDKVDDKEEEKSDSKEVQKKDKDEKAKTEENDESKKVKNTDESEDSKKTDEAEDNKAVQKEEPLTDDEKEQVDEAGEKLKELLEKILDLFEKYLSNENNDGEISVKDITDKIKALVNSEEFAALKENFELFKDLFKDEDGNPKIDILKQFLKDNFKLPEQQPKLQKLNDFFKQTQDALVETNNTLGEIKDVLKEILEQLAPDENGDEKLLLENNENLQKLFNLLSKENIAETTPENIAPLNELQTKVADLPVTKNPLKEDVILDDKVEDERAILTPKQIPLDAKPEEIIKAKREAAETNAISDILVAQNTETVKNNPASEQNIAQAETVSSAEVKAIGSENASNDANSKSDLNQNFFADKNIDDAKNTPQTVESKANPKFTSFLDKAFESERQIVDRIVTQANLKITGSTKEITFHLEPPDLGRVRISISEENGTISGKIRVDTDAIKEIVESNIGQLKESLNQNLKVDKLEVEVRSDSDQSKDLDFSTEGGKRDGTKSNHHDSDFHESNFYNDNLSENFGLDVPLPKGVEVKTDGLVSVDLIG